MERQFIFKCIINFSCVFLIMLSVSYKPNINYSKYIEHECYRFSVAVAVMLKTSGCRLWKDYGSKCQKTKKFWRKEISEELLSASSHSQLRISLQTLWLVPDIVQLAGHLPCMQPTWYNVWHNIWFPESTQECSLKTDTVDHIIDCDLKNKNK